MNDIRVIISPLRFPFAQACAQWSKDEWPHHPINADRNAIIARYENRAKKQDRLLGMEDIPLTWVSTINGAPVGMVSLLEEEHEDYTDLTPWVAGMYVVPEFRRQGIASKLMKNLHREAIDLGFQTLHLSTPDMDALYEKNGWEIINNEARDTEKIHPYTNIMRIDL